MAGTAGGIGGEREFALIVFKPLEVHVLLRQVTEVVIVGGAEGWRFLRETDVWRGQQRAGVRVQVWLRARRSHSRGMRENAMIAVRVAYVPACRISVAGIIDMAGYTSALRRAITPLSEREIGARLLAAPLGQRLLRRLTL